MLVLSRKVDQEIVIGDEVRIMVIEIRGDKVRLGVDAPKDVPIHRLEVHEAIQRSADELAAEDAARRLDQQTIAEAAADPAGGGLPS